MQKFNERYQKLNEAQRSAVDQIEGPVLVIAGPGTGKTELLTTRVANILLKSDARPENILCLTFTESAAYEMRQRLINIIGQKAYNVTISTYHAFGKELISRFPEYFTESVNTTPIDELGQYRIISAISENLEISNQLKYTDCKDILGTISELKRSLITPSNLKKTASENLKFIAKYSEITKSVLGKVKRIDKSSISLFEELLLKSKKSYGTLQALYYQELESAFQDAITSNKTSSLTAWKNKWLAKDSHDEFVINGESMNRKLLALSDVYRDYIDELNKNNLFDYDDMILKAISGLEKHKELKYTLQEQYLYILLDEFQDTNEAQFKLVNLLSDSPLYEQKPN
ncbi:UvrD-helicase domain-containing protein, partial [Candidatus Saccharibacteria bacterium]|nr:UvrD-helicase domain-containing protein [Candidatus Saccharibacteria bacterium]